MFTKSDYIEYFSQISSIEQEMISYLEEGLKKIHDEDIKAQLKAVKEDEHRHYLLVKDIIDAINKV